MLSQVNPLWAIGGLASALLCELLCAVRWLIMLRIFNIPIGFGRVCAFSFAGLFYSLFLPGAGGGDFFRIIYVIRLHPGQKRRAVVSVIADRLCGLVALAIFLSVVFLFRDAFPVGSPARMILGVSLLVLSVSVALVFLWWMTTLPFMQKRARFIPARVRESMVLLGKNFWEILRHPGGVFAGVAVSCAALLAHVATYFFSALAFGVFTSFWGMFLIMPVVDAFILLPVTFFGVGLRETLFQNLLGSMYGVAPAAAALAALGGFGFQAVIGLLGGLLIPFTTPSVSTKAPERRAE